MITNYFIQPNPQLSCLVDRYILATSDNAVIQFSGPWAASNETSLVFNLGDKPVLHGNDDSRSNIENRSTSLIGVLTRYNGFVNFYGRYHTFIIQFKANGLNKISGIPVSTFTNNIYSVDEVFGNRTRQFFDQLLHAPDIYHMADVADLFLLALLRCRKLVDLEDGIAIISKELLRSTDHVSVCYYAAKANMSVRNFERRFSEQIGISPKFYCKLARFNEAVNRKIMNPEKNWTCITHECNYYDQMHLIRDFKQFANSTPQAFFNSYINAGKRDGESIEPQAALLPKEKFVFVRH